MTDDTMPFLDALLKRGGGDFMKELAEEVLQRLMAYDIDGRVGAGRYERNDERTTQRNGYRERAFDTRLGTLASGRVQDLAPSRRSTPAANSKAGGPDG